MDLDSAYIEPLLDDWLEDLRTVIKQEESLVRNNDKFYMPFVAIPAPIVSAIFQITEHLDLSPDVRYITIHLYDRFMCNYFWEVYKAVSIYHTKDSWAEVCKRISSQSKLYLISCLQLASKMDSYSKNLGVSQVHHILRWIDKKSDYSQSIIFSTEFKVFQMVGFKIPFCTPLNCVEVLLAATGLRNMPKMQDITISLLDLVYLQREKLYSHLQCLIQGQTAKTNQDKRNLMTLESNALFLGASIVLCATFFTYIEAQTAKIIASKLSKLVDIELDNIWDMANILLVLAIQE
ncbi:cyclin N-terminal domain-containing protein 1 isoform X2 [Halictus rubicundus]|uniref:cyclin N-terminal domain-containing protein 1 isoform X2 n=1 Tax=Halictus rubicundus TaxID=77578 RepID=UPI004035AF0D